MSTYKSQVMLATSLRDIRGMIKESLWQYILSHQEIFVELKLDGLRGYILNNKFYSRYGNQFNLDLNLPEELKDYVLDGEFYNHKTKVYGAMAVRSNEPDITKLKFYIFDCIPKNDFINGVSHIDLYRRKQMLNNIYHNLKLDSYYDDFFRLVSYRTIKTKDLTISKLDSMINKSIKQGYEGLILKIKESPYIRGKRSKDWIKAKPVIDIDVEIVKFQEGEGRLKNHVGAIIVRYNGKMFKTGIIGPETFKKWLWDNKDKFEGVIATISTFEITPKISARNGFIYRIRLDKTPKAIRQRFTKQDIIYISQYLELI